MTIITASSSKAIYRSDVDAATVASFVATVTLNSRSIGYGEACECIDAVRRLNSKVPDSYKALLSSNKEFAKLINLVAGIHDVLVRGDKRSVAWYARQFDEIKPVGVLFDCQTLPQQCHIRDQYNEAFSKVTKKTSFIDPEYVCREFIVGEMLEKLKLLIEIVNSNIPISMEQYSQYSPDVLQSKLAENTKNKATICFNTTSIKSLLDYAKAVRGERGEVDMCQMLGRLSEYANFRELSGDLNELINKTAQLAKLTVDSQITGNKVPGVARLLVGADNVLLKCEQLYEGEKLRLIGQIKSGLHGMLAEAAVALGVVAREGDLLAVEAKYRRPHSGGREEKEVDVVARLNLDGEKRLYFFEVKSSMEALVQSIEKGNCQFSDLIEVARREKAVPVIIVTDDTKRSRSMGDIIIEKLSILERKYGVRLRVLNSKFEDIDPYKWEV